VNLECLKRDGDEVPVLPAIVKQNRVDGVLLAGEPPREIVQAICDLDMPVVGINDSTERLNISCVSSQPEQAIHECIVQLAGWGHRQFGILLFDLKYQTHRARYHSYLAALKEVGIQPNPAWVVTDLAGEISAGRDGVRKLLARGPLPTAILCCNDWLATGAMHELQRQGVRIPDDVSLVGHDDLPFCEQLEPTLTSIHRAEEEIVSQAVDLLVEQIQEGIQEPRQESVRGEMVWRQSTGRAPDHREGD